MDNKLLEKTRAKLKHELSSEEQEALRKCSATVNFHSRVGAMLGGSLSVYGMYRRKLWPLSKYWGRGLFFGIGGIVVGMQLGLVSASIRCVQIVKALPDPQHVMKALREVQVELQDARRRPLQGEREWTQRGEGEEVAETQPMAGISRADEPRSADDFGVRNPYNGPGPDPQSTQGKANQNVWQRIRGDSNQSDTAWDRLRKTGSSAAPVIAKDDSPFATSPTDTSFAATDSAPVVEMSEDENERAMRQSEFDRLLERERMGEVENNTRRKNKFGDYE